jgi:hypothetical protein
VALFVGGLAVYAAIIILSTMLLPKLQNDTFDMTKNATANNKQRNVLMTTTASSQEQREYWRHMLEKARAEFPHNPHQQQQQQPKHQQGPELTSRQQWYPGHHVMVYNRHPEKISSSGNNNQTKDDKSHHLDSFGRPPLSSLINKTHILVDPYFTSTISSNNNNIYNVSWLLDFAIIGFGKSGTSSVLYWLSQQDHVSAFTPEVWELMLHQPHKMVEYLYRDLPRERHLRRGYKGPSDVTQAHVIDYFRNYFPQTKLIVGLRHPIRFFESLCK